MGNYVFQVVLVNAKGSTIKKVHAYNEIYEVLNLYAVQIAGGFYKGVECIIITKLEEI